MSAKKPFFASHAKSSAALISLAVHAVLIVIALFFVAVTVIQKNEVDFEAKSVTRPKMNLRKLKVPVNIKKTPQQPELRKQIVAAPKLNKVMPDIKMPEIVGVKGGLGSAGRGGLGGGASLGFAMPNIDVFGIKGKGEKVFFILDSSTEMMWDEMGGIPAYTIIKNELVSIIDSLPPTTLFNVVVYDNSRTFMLFPQMVMASSMNVAKVDEWLKPLNSVKPGMGADEYGVSTLGKGGNENSEDFRIGRFERQELWYRPAMLAMKQQADAVFVLTSWWGEQRIKLDDRRQKKWYETSASKEWWEYYEKSKQLLDEDNRQRAARGEAPRAINRDNPWDMNSAYFPDIEFPPDAEWEYYEPREFAEAMVKLWEQYAPKSAMAKLGLSRKKSGKYGFSFNVVRFAKKAGEWSEYRDGRTENNFKKLASNLQGNYETIAGLEAIKSSVKGN